MREIKFRVWDNFRKKFAKQIISIEFERCNHRHGIPYFVVYTDKTHRKEPIRDYEKIFTNDFEILQYTGVKDIHKVEIYIGDIVRLHWEYPEDDPIIIKNVCDGYFKELEEDKCEVIGNIFENPELLKR